MKLIWDIFFDKVFQKCTKCTKYIKVASVLSRPQYDILLYSHAELVKSSKRHLYAPTHLLFLGWSRPVEARWSSPSLPTPTPAGWPTCWPTTSTPPASRSTTRPWPARAWPFWSPSTSVSSSLPTQPQTSNNLWSRSSSLFGSQERGTGSVQTLQQMPPRSPSRFMEIYRRNYV